MAIGRVNRVSASSPLVGFGGLDDNMIKGLIILLSVEQEFDYIAYTCEMNCCMT
jgi:hypothetical protein